MEIQFSQPILDITVVPANFSFTQDQQPFPNSGTTFSTYRHGQQQTADQVNDEYITIEFQPKGIVNQVTYTKGSLKGMNGLDVETQLVTPVLE